MDKKLEIVFYVGTRKLIILEGKVGEGEPCVLRYDRCWNPAGFENGFVTNLEKAVHGLQKLVDEFLPSRGSGDISASVVLGNAKIRSYSCSSSQYYLGTQRTITTNEIRQVVGQTRGVATLPLSECVLQALPECFIVDDMSGVRDPVGLEAQRLGVNLKIFTMNFESFKNLSKAFEAAEIHVNGYYPKPLTVSEAVLTEKEKEEGVLLVDIADDTAYLVLWKNGCLAGTRSLPLGGRYLTAEVASAWQIEGYDAEKVKERYGSLNPDPKFQEEIIPLVERNGKGNHQIPRREFQDRFFQLCRQWMEQMVREMDGFAQDHKVLYPHYVFTGGGTCFDGFLEFLQKEFQREARLGLTHMMKAPNELIMDPSLTAALGMYRWLATNDRQNKRLLEPAGFMEKTFASARDWFMNYF